MEQRKGPSRQGTRLLQQQRIGACVAPGAVHERRGILVGEAWEGQGWSGRGELRAPVPPKSPVKTIRLYFSFFFPGRPAGFSWVRSRKLPRRPAASPTLFSPNRSRSLSAAARASFQRC